MTSSSARTWLPSRPRNRRGQHRGSHVVAFALAVTHGVAVCGGQGRCPAGRVGPGRTGSPTTRCAADFRRVLYGRLLACPKMARRRRYWVNPWPNPKGRSCARLLVGSSWINPTAGPGRGARRARLLGRRRRLAAMYVARNGSRCPCRKSMAPTAREGGMRKSVGTAARRLHRLQVVRHLSHVLRAPVRLFGTNLPWSHSSQNLYRSGWRNVFVGPCSLRKVHGAAGRIAGGLVDIGNRTPGSACARTVQGRGPRLQARQLGV